MTDCGTVVDTAAPIFYFLFLIFYLSNRRFDVHFGETQYLPLLLLLAGGLVALALYALARDRRDLEKLGFRNMVLSPRAALVRRGVVAALLIAAMGLALAGSARLQGRLVPQDMESVGSDVMICLDVSKSMLTGDVNPSRLAVAKAALLDWLVGREGDRVGLTVFAGEAAVQVPLTLDHDAVSTVLERADVDALDRGGSDIGDAIRTALASFPTPEAGKEKEQDKRGKALVIVTDGELTREASDIDAAVEEARKRGVLILAVGVGTRQGRPIPDGYSIWGEPIYKQDESGQVVVSRLDEANLRRIAAATGGAYVSGESRKALGELGPVLDRMQRTALKGKGSMKREELSPTLGAATAGLLLLAFLL